MLYDFSHTLFVIRASIIVPPLRFIPKRADLYLLNFIWFLYIDDPHLHLDFRRDVNESHIKEVWTLHRPWSYLKKFLKMRWGLLSILPCWIYSGYIRWYHQFDKSQLSNFNSDMKSNKT